MLNSIQKRHVLVLSHCFVAMFFLSVLPRVTFAQPDTFSGWLSVIYGDTRPGSGEAPRFVASLSDGQSRLLATLNMDRNLARSLSGQYVEVTGTASQVSAQDTGATTIQVESIRVIEPPAGTELGVSAASVSHPYLNLRCYFPDSFDIDDPAFAEYPASYYDQLFQDTYPGLNNYFQQMSYGQIDLNGTVTAPNIYMLPYVRSHYLVGGYAHTYDIANDCFMVADATINFHAYSGINVMLNYDLDCCAWGGGYPYTLDGQPLQYFPTTWMPPWGQQYGTLGHEIGHSFDMMHSSGPASHPPPDDLSIYISDWDIMSKSSGAFNEHDPVYGFVPPGTIAYNIDRAGWMPANRKIQITPGKAVSVTLEQLRTTTPASLPANTYLMAQIPINGSASHFYTVEVRTHVSYDKNIPPFGPQAAVVLIFEVNTNSQSNAGPALIVDVDFANGTSNGDVNDDGAMWTTGEKFYDSKSGISITIGALVGTQYTVTVAKESTPSAAPVRNLYRTGMPTLRWNQISWAVGYQVQIDNSSTISAPYVLYANNLPPSQLSFTPALSLPDGIYYWRVCALKADLTCGSWSTPESFQIDTSP